MWSIGLICGPVLGGMLTNPTENFPALFGSCPFLKSNPYFLPCFISACISFIGFIIGFFFLSETKGMDRYKRLPSEDDVSFDTDAITIQNELSRNECDNTSLSSQTSSYISFSQSRPNDAQSVARESISTIVNSDRDSVVNSSAHVSPCLSNTEAGCLELDNQSSAIDKANTKEGIGAAAISSILAYGLLSFQNIIFDETFSLWIVTPMKNGLIKFRFC